MESDDDPGGTERYRVEAEVLSKDAAYHLREIIEDNVDCRLTAFDQSEGTETERDGGTDDAR